MDDPERIEMDEPGFAVGEYVRADLFAALEQERDELLDLVGPALAQGKQDSNVIADLAAEVERLRAAIAEIRDMARSGEHYEPGATPSAIVAICDRTETGGER